MHAGLFDESTYFFVSRRDTRPISLQDQRNQNSKFGGFSCRRFDGWDRGGGGLLTLEPVNRKGGIFFHVHDHLPKLKPHLKVSSVIVYRKETQGAKCDSESPGHMKPVHRGICTGQGVVHPNSGARESSSDVLIVAS